MIAHERSLRMSDFDELQELIRRPFRSLLLDITASSQTRWLSGRDERVPSGTPNAVSASLSASIAVARFTQRIMGYCEMLSCRLNYEENELWNNFVLADDDLKAALPLHGDALLWALEQVNLPQEQIEEWIETLEAEVQGDDDGVDFADLLHLLSLQSEPVGSTMSLTEAASAVRTSIIKLWNNATASPIPCMHRHILEQVRLRCARMENSQLAVAAAAYQRSVVLSFCWRCEKQILDEVMPKSTSLITSLLVVLRMLNRAFTPVQRALWELLSTASKNFDGLYTRGDVEEALGVFPAQAAQTTAFELSELHTLRRECQGKTMNKLFGDSPCKVSLAHVVHWWTNMDEDFRLAAGFDIPPYLVHRALGRQPEEMFRTHLRTCAGCESEARTALRGHVLVLAEFRAAAVWRGLADVHDQSTCGTGTNTSQCSYVSEEENPDARPSKHEGTHDQGDVSNCEDNLSNSCTSSTCESTTQAGSQGNTSPSGYPKFSG